MYAIDNPIFKTGYFKENTWLYIQSRYTEVVIHLIEDSNYQLYAYDIGYDYKNNIPLIPVEEKTDDIKCILLSVHDEMEDYRFIIREATQEEITKTINLTNKL